MSHRSRRRSWPVPRGSPSGARAGRAHPHVASEVNGAGDRGSAGPDVPGPPSRIPTGDRDDPRDCRQLGCDPEGCLAGHPPWIRSSNSSPSGRHPSYERACSAPRSASPRPRRRSASASWPSSPTGSAPRVTLLDQHRRHCLGEWHLVRHELHDALEVVAPTVASARRRGKLSALVPPLVLHALVLQAIDRPEGSGPTHGPAPTPLVAVPHRPRRPVPLVARGTPRCPDTPPSRRRRHGPLRWTSYFELAPTALAERS